MGLFPTLQTEHLHLQKIMADVTTGKDTPAGILRRFGFVP
jgi:hypothetical protein